MEPLQYYVISIAVCVVHVALIVWTLWKLPMRDWPLPVSLAICAVYAASCYLFFFVYKPFIYIDSIIFSIICCVLFIALLWRTDARNSIMLGLAITLCYSASRDVVLYVAVMGFQMTVPVMEASAGLRCAVEGIGALIAFLVLMSLRRHITEAVTGDVPIGYIALLLQPLLIALAVGVWVLPVIDGTSPVLWCAPVIVMGVAELAVITSTVAVISALEARHRAQEVGQLEELMIKQHEALMSHNSTDEAVERIAHDIKNHLMCIGELDSSKEIEDHLKDISDEVYRLHRYPYTGNPTLDAILNEKAEDAKRDDIDFEVLMDFSEGSFLKGFDITAIFGNALDNAMRAVREVDDPAKRMVTIKSTCISGRLVVKVTNYFATSLVWEDGVLLSTKRGREGKSRGFGLRSIEYSVSRYGGHMEVSQEEDLFTLSIVIPVPDDDTHVAGPAGSDARDGGTGTGAASGSGLPAN